MMPAERCVLVMLLQELRPEYAIEIGTSYGGSLSVLSRFAQHVYTLDINPVFHQQLQDKYSNVEFITGNSNDTFPALLANLQASRANLGLILIDGDHSRSGRLTRYYKYLAISAACSALHSYAR